MASSLRQIAQTCRVSVSTVSRALADRPYVRADIRAKIRQEAARAGYRPNQLIGTVMAHVRRGDMARLHGNLAIVHVPARENRPVGPQERVIIESAQARATERGFSMELFELSLKPRGRQALAHVLSARGVSGLICVYPEPTDAMNDFPWNDFSAVAIDLPGATPLLTTICHDHFSSMTRALLLAQAKRYTKVGLFIEHHKDSRTGFRWSAAFRSFQETTRAIGTVPPLIEGAMSEAAFATWFRDHQPDLVIGHFDECMLWLRRLQRTVPRHTGFFGLNWLSRGRPIAGIDPLLNVQGSVATDSLISEIQSVRRGCPQPANLILVPGQIVEGPSWRESPASPAVAPKRPAHTLHPAKHNAR